MKIHTTFGRGLAGALALALGLATAPVSRAETPHLVPPEQVGARLDEEAAARAARVAAVQQVLDSPEAHRQAGVLGVNIGKLRAAVPHLSDAELADLGQRARNASDVAAGYHDEGLVILGVALLVAGVVLLVALEDDYYDDGYYDDCYCY